MATPLEELWPPFGIRLKTPRLELRPGTEADLPELAALLPEDSEQDPRLPRHVDDDEATRRHRVVQSYWRALGSWTAESWNIGFVVSLEGRTIGVQGLEANEFPKVRLVETSSWLVAAHRGKGLGKEMRAAVLHLAFEGLGALVAETDAWHDNEASLGVSRALGYVPNGETLHPRGEQPDRMVRMRLPRADWKSPVAVEISGLEPCRALFQI
jgi:RimJ/RimL family protein N-acetyltransferase